MKNFVKSFSWALIAAAPLLFSPGSSLSAQDAGPLSLSEEVHTAGQVAYERAYAGCHLVNLLGSFEAPELAGPNFRAVWTERTLSEFRATVRTMPPTAPNSLRGAEYDAITVYLLAANGLERDGRVVQADRETNVGSMLTGAVAGVSAAAAAGRRAAAADGGRASPVGVTETFHEVADFEPVTQQELLNPDDGDWLIYRRTYDSQGYSPLDQIDRSNVDDLRLAWVWAMGDGTSQPTPLVHDGIVYLANPGNVIQALDGTDGTLLWQYRREFTDDFSRGGFSQLRNLAILRREHLRPDQGRLHGGAERPHGGDGVGDSDRRLSPGLHQRGRSDRRRGEGTERHQWVHPLLRRELLYHGARRRHWRGSVAHLHGCPSGRARGDTWGDLPLELRGGVDVWNTGRYDPELGSSTGGRPRPSRGWPRAAASPFRTQHSYSNSTLAIDPDDGSIVWYRQHVPGESLDLDEAFEQILIDRNGQRLLFAMGKHGILWKLNRESGQYLAHKESVYQNIFDFIDPRTGVVRYREDIASAGIGDWVSVCPSTAGGHNWPSMSYSPEVNALIVPLSQSCLEIQGAPDGA